MIFYFSKKMTGLYPDLKRIEKKTTKDNNVLEESLKRIKQNMISRAVSLDSRLAVEGLRSEAVLRGELVSDQHGS